MRLVVLLLSIVAIATSVFAVPPGELKDWENSPQGYFMTKAEHQEWAAIRTDEEARHFVDQFLAKRGPNFVTNVAASAQQADKHLTLGKLAGSKTLRGKLVILFGPPSDLGVADIEDNSGVHHDSPAMAGALTGGSASGGSTGRGAGDSESNEGARTMGSASIIRNYHFTYASSVAGPIDVTISTDPNTGKDRPRDRESSKKLDAAFEAAAQASIKNK
ncbi:MAG: GWxTD domain-containing protein [Thermoanaerobaculia bacterium]